MPALTRNRTNPALSEHIAKLLEAANSASQTVAALHVAFVAFAAYLVVIIWGTTHEDLLRISAVKLPILDVDLPLATFYGGVPWLLVLLHFNLLIQLELLSRKLWNLDHDLPDTPTGQQVRDQLFIFPFTHLIAGRSTVPVRWLLSMVVGFTVIVLPLVILLATQIGFLPFHNEIITWSQRIAVWFDILILIVLWPLIVSPKDSWWESWRNLYWLPRYWFTRLWHWAGGIWNWIGRLIPRYLPRLRWNQIALRPILYVEAKGMVVLLLSMLLSVGLSFFAVIPGSMTVEAYYHPPKAAPKNIPYYFEDRLIRYMPEAWLSTVGKATQIAPRVCSTLKPTGKSEQVMLNLTCTLFEVGIFPRNLNLKETHLDISRPLLIRATDSDKAKRAMAFKEFYSFNLQERDLRFANLSSAVLPKVDLRGAKLQGADLNNAKLQGANLRNTELQGANLFQVRLQGAYLSYAHLEGANLTYAYLQESHLDKAVLQGANLFGGQLQGAEMKDAQLQGTDLSNAKLQGANLDGAQLKSANLKNTYLQGAYLGHAHLQGVILNGAKLQQAILFKTQFQGTTWSNAQLDEIFISDTQGADWSENQYRLKHIRRQLPGVPKSQVSCYSDNPSLLQCDYNKKEYLSDYRAKLHPKLIELACSDTTIAEGIVRRGYRVSDHGGIKDSDFGLASALLKKLDAPLCAGLDGLSKEIWQQLRKEEMRQKNEKESVQQRIKQHRPIG